MELMNVGNANLSFLHLPFEELVYFYIYSLSKRNSVLSFLCYEVSGTECTNLLKFHAEMCNFLLPLPYTNESPDANSHSDSPGVIAEARWETRHDATGCCLPTQMKHFSCRDTATH